eukprot:1085906-Amorphochlora_amoeboformis.AAC.1
MEWKAKLFTKKYCNCMATQSITRGYLGWVLWVDCVNGVTSRFVTTLNDPWLPGTTGSYRISRNLQTLQRSPAICSIRTTILEHAIDIYSSNCVPSCRLYWCF